MAALTQIPFMPATEFPSAPSETGPAPHSQTSIHSAPPAESQSENPAVTRCCEAHDRALALAKARRKDSFDAQAAAKRAFRLAMPPLAGQENVANFIACVAHAMLVEIISGSEASQLLYAAQVASMANRRPEPRKQSKTL